MNRRDFLLATLAGTSLTMLPAWARSNRIHSQDFLPYESDISPVQRLSSFSGSSEIEGDLPDEAHEIFWDKTGYVKKKGGIPVSRAEYDVIVVGGGLAGLSAAHALKNHKILLLEGHPRLGGNAKTQAVGQNLISQGSAYITEPEAGGEIDRFLSNLGLKNKFRKVQHSDEAVTINGQAVTDFWSGSSAPEAAIEFKRAREKFTDVYENHYPELPIWNNSSSAINYFRSLDSISFDSWVKRELGSTHPHLLEFINLYCWSSFSASAQEISAAHGLNFLSADLNGILVLPGGNGLIAEALYQNLKRRSNVKLAAHSFAVDIQSAGGKAVVCFKNTQGGLETVSARHCLVASPKLVSKFVIQNIPAAQKKAMEDIDYRSYLMCNVFLKKKVRSPGYDLFTMKGKVPLDTYNESKERVFTDVIFADWALKDLPAQSILSLYIPLPYAMANQYLFVPGLFEKYSERIKPQLMPILNHLGLRWSDIQGMRLVRYGHAIPLAKVGGVSSGTFERASQSIDGCIHFANQDNWGNPCFETSLGSAWSAVKKITG